MPGRPQMLWRRSPVSSSYGYDRGTPIDRYYLDHWLRGHGSDIRGAVLDIGDDDHARRYGADLSSVDVLNPAPEIPGTTVVGNLETGAGMPERSYDCFLLLQTLLLVYDLRRAAQAAFDTVRPGGVVLATVSGIQRLETGWTDYWRLTGASMQRLFAEPFGPENVSVATYGNVMSASAFLYGLAAEELRRPELDAADERYQVLVAVRARRPAE